MRHRVVHIKNLHAKNEIFTKLTFLQTAKMSILMGKVFWAENPKKSFYGNEMFCGIHFHYHKLFILCFGKPISTLKN